MPQAELESGKLKRQRPAKKGGILHSAEACAPRSEGLRLLEGLAATGLRAIRYASEVGHTRLGQACVGVCAEADCQGCCQ